jgi:hypothetical protein
MSNAQLERLNDHMTRLRLFKNRERLGARLQKAVAEEPRCAEFLEQVFSEEVASKTARNVPDGVTQPSPCVAPAKPARR